MTLDRKKEDARKAHPTMPRAPSITSSRILGDSDSEWATDTCGASGPPALPLRVGRWHCEWPFGGHKVLYTYQTQVGDHLPDAHYL